MTPFKVALLFGGPSEERGISLNSARSVNDHLDGVDIIPLYFNLDKVPHFIDRKHLYSNTPSDFDFKINSIGTPLTEGELVGLLQEADICFPVIHGAFGEGGELAGFLEANRIPFIGCNSASSSRAFDKHVAAGRLRSKGFHTPPSLLLENPDAPALGKIEKFFRENGLKKAILKPARSGSSIGVTVVTSPRETLKVFQSLHAQKLDTRFVLEPYMEGREFTVIILQNTQGEPVSLLPTEIEITDADQSLFDYRLKYLPTRQVLYHMPPRFSSREMAEIQEKVEALFTLMDLRDAVRVDGWLLPDGNIWFSDFNLASGLDQNSFFFLQAAYLGWSHSRALHYVLHSACCRRGIQPPRISPSGQKWKKRAVRVLFGGDSSERQVSLMSGSNVWLKLRKSPTYSPEPYLLDIDGRIWKLPYPAALRHTVEEVSEACRQIIKDMDRLTAYQTAIGSRLQPDTSLPLDPLETPLHMNMEEFIQDPSIVFLAVHGGMGENGKLQEILAGAKIPFTGSLSASARLCMDKFDTGKALENYGKHGIFVAPKQKLDTRTLLGLEESKLQKVWNSLVETLKSETPIVKPLADGCSSGVVRLANWQDLAHYLKMIGKGADRIPPGVMTYVASTVELPRQIPDFLLFETFVESDQPTIRGRELHWNIKSGWVEITVGVLGKHGEIRALKPSIAIAAGQVLSLEEKFQGGTGINITPPPEPWVAETAWNSAQRKIEFVAQKLGINGFARIDAFMEVQKGNLLVIEANTIPGLTPSTVIYQQALAEEPAIDPTQFLEKILEYRNTFS